MSLTAPHLQPTHSTVPVGSVWAIPDVLRELGAEPAAVLKDAGLEPTLFDDRQNLVSFAARGRLLAHCARATGCQHFGLLVGQRGGLHTVGLVGLLAKYSPDVGTALRNLVGYFRLHLRGAVTSVEVDGEIAMLTYDVLEPDLEGLEQTYGGVVATMLNIMRGLCGPGWKPLEARFAHRRPADVLPFRQFFGVPLTFDAERCALVFKSHWLDSRVRDADPELQRLLQDQVNALLPAPDEDFTGHVRGILRTALLSGHGSATQVAALLGMHPRTLSRRLQERDSSFQQLVDEARFSIARQMLEHTSIDISEIAASLDYSDASAFTRSFRRWSGTTPALWRAQRSGLSKEVHSLSENVKREAARRD
jgi:AraC-like DNA-binding protein